MSLLTSLRANPLDAGYEHYRAEHGPRPTGLFSRLAVFAVAVALGFGSVIAIDSLRRPANDVKADLKEQAAMRDVYKRQPLASIHSLVSTGVVIHKRHCAP